MKKYLKHYYKKLLNTKTHLWSHIMALIGWIYITITVLLIYGFRETFFIFWIIYVLFITFCILIPSLVLAYIEHIFFKKLRIQWTFLTKNPFYNAFWLMGYINFVIFITLIVFYKPVLKILEHMLLA